VRLPADRPARRPVPPAEGRAPSGPGAAGAGTRGALVEIGGLSKRYAAESGEVLAVSDVDLVVEPGRFVALVGPSGCGKSTLLRLLAGIERQTAGSIQIDGKPPQSLAADHGLGVAFQEHALMPWLSVRKNVALPFRLAGLAVDWNLVDSLVELVGLSDFARTRPGRLSGGMRQRVSIARSLVLNPRLLLLDEPFGALDLVTRRTLNFEMQRIWTELDATTVLVTHSVEEALILGDSVFVMSARPGRLIASFDIDAARPRTLEYSGSSGFARLKREVTMSLDAAAGIDDVGQAAE